MTFSTINLLIHTVLTFSMTGIIWFVQLIYYPVMRCTMWKESETFAKVHWQKTMKLATVMLSLELLTGILLVLFRPIGISLTLPIFGFLLLILIWIITWWTCVPNHCVLKQKYSEKSLDILLVANKWRAIVWSIRSVTLFYILLILLGA